MDNSNYNHLGKQRVSKKFKNKNNKAWYKEQLNILDSRSEFNEDAFFSYSDPNDFKRKKINYDMVNNIVNLEDYNFITNPSGDNDLNLPATMMNRDIINPKLKVIQGLAMNRPFDYKFVAVNPEATSRREQFEFNKIKEYVEAEIMRPIKEQMLQQKMQEMQSQGIEISEEMLAKAQQEIEQESKKMSPEELKTYMRREHQDPAEVLANQLCSFLIKEHDIERIINKAWKHAMISAYEVYYVGILNKQLITYEVNSLYFDCDKSSIYDDIADAEWAKYDMYLTPSQVVRMFGEELSNKQIDNIYESASYRALDEFDFTGDSNDNNNYSDKIRVMHGTWKSLSKIGTLTYIDENGEEQQTFVSEDYKLDKRYDLKVEWEWIPNVEEGYKICISDSIYVYCRPVLGQNTDLDSINDAKLPYTGVVHDDTNSKPTSIVDRLKPSQYLVNIINYRIELLMASDKGKILLMNMNLIPKSAGIDIKKWHNYTESIKIGYLNPAEEGNKNAAGGDIVNAAKMVDMSLASDINNYINLLEYIERKAGESIGIPKEMEGQSSPYQSVRNTQAAMTQSKHILEPYFELHNFAKKNYLNHLVQTAKVYYQLYPREHLNYVLDDMSIQLIKMDLGLLSNNTFGIYATNNSKDSMIVENIKQLIHPAMQAGRADLSDVIRVLRANNAQEAEEFLRSAEERKSQEAHNQQMEMEKMKQEFEKEAREAEMEKMKFERETKLQVEKLKQDGAFERQLLLSTGFNEDKDMDRDGTPDLLEVAREGKDAEIKMRKQELDEKKFEHQKEVDKEKIKLEGERNKRNTTK